MCALDGARTRVPNIKSVVLYQLSYERILAEFMCASDGARTRGSYIKSVVLYQLSYERILEKSFPDLTQLIYHVPTYI